MCFLKGRYRDINQDQKPSDSFKLICIHRHTDVRKSHLETDRVELWQDVENCTYLLPVCKHTVCVCISLILNHQGNTGCLHEHLMYITSHLEHLVKLEHTMQKPMRMIHLNMSNFTGWVIKIKNYWLKRSADGWVYFTTLSSPVPNQGSILTKMIMNFIANSANIVIIERIESFDRFGTMRSVAQQTVHWNRS